MYFLGSYITKPIFRLRTSIITTNEHIDTPVFFLKTVSDIILAKELVTLGSGDDDG